MCYIYMWFNIKTNEVFYVGLGKGDRRFHTKKRNKLFKKYLEENDCAVRLYEVGLSYDEGRELEKDLIAELKPCCNMTKGGERTDGAKISKALKGKKHSSEHKQNVSLAIRQWHKEKIRNSKEIRVLDANMNLIIKFEAKYQLGNWLHQEYGYGKHGRSALRAADKFIKSKQLFEERFYFVENGVDIGQ